MNYRGCAATFFLSVAALGGEPSSSTLANSGTKAQLEALAEAKAKWARHKPKFGYDLAIQVRCFCVTMGEYVLHVQGDQVVRIDRTDEKKSPPDFVRAALANYTVDGLFARIETELNSGAETVNAIYDLISGFPIAIQIDRSVDTDDDELEMTARMRIPPEAE